MKKTLLLMVAGLMLLTQCRKDDLAGVTPGTQTVNMTVTVGTGRTDIGADGAIKWSANDKLYVSNGNKCIGCLELQSGAGASSGEFTGLVIEQKDEELKGLKEEEGTSTYHFFYLGNGDNVTFNGGTSESYENATSATIDFNSHKVEGRKSEGQTGELTKLSQYHIGYGTGKGTFNGSTITINETVKMSSKVAIAYFKFINGYIERGLVENPYVGTVTISNAYNQMTVHFDCVKSGEKEVKSDSEIFVGNGNGISLTSDENTYSQRYVMLVPTGFVETGVNLTFSKETSGSTKENPKVNFANGIEANHFYCDGGDTKKPIEVNFGSTGGK